MLTDSVRPNLNTNADENNILACTLAFALTAALGAVQAATITVTNDAATGPGSLRSAIGALSDGDTIDFNLPGTGVHYLQTPPDGYPLITKNNITIDGYTQPGAAPNAAPIHATNNAVLTICLTSTNGNALSMQTACNNSFGSPIPGLGYGNGDQAMLGFFHATTPRSKAWRWWLRPGPPPASGPATTTPGRIRVISRCLEVSFPDRSSPPRGPAKT